MRMPVNAGGKGRQGPRERVEGRSGVARLGLAQELEVGGRGGRKGDWRKGEGKTLGRCGERERGSQQDQKDPNPESWTQERVSGWS